MKSRLAALAKSLALAACLALAGCFTSEAPLFSGVGVPLFGRGVVTVTTYEAGETPETGQMEWTQAGYIEPGNEDGGATTFHHMPGSGWFSPWYVGQTETSKGDGYVYALYRKQGARLNTYDLSCEDLSPAEAVAAHLVRSESGNECKATRAGDLAEAFRLLSKRKSSNGYMTAQTVR
jgi:hypothetical protein